MVKKIMSGEYSLVENSDVAVIDFSATWCGPCQMIAPIMEEVSKELDGKVNVFNVDVDECPDLAQKFGIMSIPTLIVLKKGEKVDMRVGFAPKAEVMEFVGKHLG